MTTTITRALARIALPVVSAGLIGGAALGLAGAANAAHAIDAHRPAHSVSMTTRTAHEKVVIKKAVAHDFHEAFMAGDPAPQRQKYGG